MLSTQFKTFLIVAEAKSFSKAGQRLFLTPASIMNQMDALEKRLGVKLLERTTHGVSLTPAGKVLYGKGRRLASRCQSILSQMREEESSGCIDLRIGSSFLNPISFFLKLWEPFKEAHPEYRFSITPYGDEQQHLLHAIDELGQSMDVMVGCFDTRAIREKAEYLVLGEHRFCVAMPASHPLATKKTLSLEDLHGERLLMPEMGDIAPMDRFHAMLTEEHPQIELEPAESYYSLDTFNECARNGEMLLTLDKWAELHPSLTSVPLSCEYGIPFGLLYAKRPEKKVCDFITIFTCNQFLNKSGTVNSIAPSCAARSATGCV